MTEVAAVLAFLVAGQYAFIAVYVVPRLARLARMERRLALAVRWGATSFLVGCAITHVFIAVRGLSPASNGGGGMVMAGSTRAVLLQMVLPQLAQIVGGALFIGVSRNRLDIIVTSKKTATDTRELEIQLRSALDLAPVGIAFSSTATGASYVNPAFLDLLGFASDRPIPTAEDVLATMHPADHAAGVANMTKIRSGGASDLEFRVVRPNGAVRWIHMRRSPVIGDTVRVTTIVEDVTDRVTAHAAVATSERRFTQLADSVSVGINLRQLHPPKFLWANRAYHEIVGADLVQDPSSALDPAAPLVHPDDRDRVMGGYWPRAQSGEVADCEFRLLRPDGQLRWVHVTSAPVLDDDGGTTRVAGTVEDITDRKAGEEILAGERRRLRQAESIGLVGSWETDLDSGASAYSAGMFELWGIDPATFDGDDAVALRQVHPDDRTALDAAVSACRSTGQPTDLRFRMYRCDDGELRWIHVRCAAAEHNGRIVRIGGSVADVTAQVEAEATAAAARSFQQAVFSASPDILSVWDFETASVTWSNRGIGAELGYSATDLAKMNGRLAHQLVHPDDQARFFEATAAAQDSPDDTVIHVDYRMLRKDGTSRWFSRRTAPLLRDEHHRVTQIVGVITDITDRMTGELQLRHSALHDSLTGLPNRALLIDRIASGIARADREDTEVGVLFCDLDGFKGVNDTGGHAAGDAVLVEVSERLRQSIRKSDSVARVGGDEFVIILEPSRTPDRPLPEPRSGDDPGDTDQDAAAVPLTMQQVAELVAGRIRSKLVAPVMYDGQAYSVSVSIGMTFAGRGSVADEVLRDADKAMYEAKQRGRDRFHIFDEVLRAESAHRVLVERTLRNALGLDGPMRAQLSVAYQPVFDLADGYLVGFEALARLTGADGTPIAPDAFIPVAENTGLIAAVGATVLDLALAGLARWRAAHAGVVPATMAVNLSARQAHQNDLASTVLGALARHALRPADLVLELTESILLDTGSAEIGQLTALREAGVGIAVDDFGTGYASLRYLATLPISSLKVDKSVTAGLPDDTTSATISRAIAALAAELGLSCVVQGIETYEQLVALPVGVLGQGYLLGRPTGDFSGISTSILTDTAPGGR